MKYRVFWLTYIAYAINHALRVCYSFNKPSIKDTFELSNMFLGILDGITFISYGIGTLIRYEIFPVKSDLPRNFYKISLMISVFFSVVPFLSYFVRSEWLQLRYHEILIKVILIIGFLGYGFFHFAVYQIPAALVGSYINAKEQGSLMGFWASMGCFGNIVGFALSNLVVHQLECRWEVSLLLLSIFNIVTAALIYMFIEDPSSRQRDPKYNHFQEVLDQDEVNEQELRTRHFVDFIKTLFVKRKSFKFFFLSFLTLTTCTYTYLMWFPTFLTSSGFAQVSGYVSTLFDFGGTLGTVLVGKLFSMHYENMTRLSSKPGSQKSITDWILEYRNVLIILIIIGIILMFLVVESSIVIYSVLNLGMGIFLQGIFFPMAVHESFIYAEHSTFRIDMLVTLLTGFGTITTGIFQILVGFLLTNQKNKDQKTEDFSGFFIVMITIMLVAAVMFFLKTRHQSKEEQMQKQSEIKTN